MAVSYDGSRSSMVAGRFNHLLDDESGMEEEQEKEEEEAKSASLSSR